MAIYAGAIGLALAVHAADRRRLPKMPDTTPPGKPHFDSTGERVRRTVPGTCRSIRSTARKLHCTVFARGVTRRCCSLRRIPARNPASRIPDAAKLAEKFEKLDPDRIYLRHRSPSEGRSVTVPGAEDLTTENQRDHVFCSQPRTLEERLVLAKQFEKRLEVSQPIYVDAMDNAIWKSLGGGPNMGFLVDQRRRRSRPARLVRRQIDGSRGRGDPRRDAEVA